MFLPIVADQVQRLVRRLGEPGPPARKSTAMAVAPPAGPFPLVANPPAGTRYQLFRALRAMAQGQMMLVERRLPSLPGHFKDAVRRQQLWDSLRDASGWQGQSGIHPLLVPGTAYPAVVGVILIRAGWCAPCASPHWVPNLRFFYLTEPGRETAAKAQAWWAGLTPLERVRVMLLE